MCGRYRLARDDERIAAELGVKLPAEWGEIRVPFRLPRHNAAPTQTLPVVRLGRAGERELVGLRWGLVPSWSRDPASGPHPVNARAETVAVRPAFRDAFRRRRCLVPADGFYEWQPVGRRKQPWLVRRKDGDLFAFAGLWERWHGAGSEPLETFSILVTDANDLLQPLHDRMPVILAPGDYGAWLDVSQFDRARLESLLKPFPAEGLEAYPVSTRVNSPANDDEACSAPTAAPG